MTSYKKIYIIVTSKTEKVAKTTTNTYLFYDRNTKQMKKIEASKLKYKYDYKTKSMSCEGENLQHVAYEKRSNLEKINNIIQRNDDILTVNDEETTKEVLCLVVRDRNYDEVLDILDNNRIEYRI